MYLFIIYFIYLLIFPFLFFQLHWSQSYERNSQWSGRGQKCISPRNKIMPLVFVHFYFHQLWKRFLLQYPKYQNLKFFFFFLKNNLIMGFHIQWKWEFCKRMEGNHMAEVKSSPCEEDSITIKNWHDCKHISVYI